MAVPPGPPAGGEGGSTSARPVEEPVHTPLKSRPGLDLFFAALGRERRWPTPVPHGRVTGRLDLLRAEDPLSLYEAPASPWEQSNA